MRLLFLSLIVALQAPFVAQSNRDDLTPLDLSYALDVLPSRAGLHVELTIDRNSRPIVRVAMPNWAPGSYGIKRYGEGVKNLKVTDERAQKELETTALDHQTWSIAANGAAKIKVSYDIPEMEGRFAAGRPKEPAKITGFHFQGPATYMYVVGAKNLPCRVTYRLPEGWNVANGLLRTENPNARWAVDYDTFIDCPTIIGQYLEKTFEVDGVPFHCIFQSPTQNYDFDADGYAEMVKKIVTVQGKIYGGFPFPDYWFLFSISAGGGGGGLEHLNSTSIGLSGPGLKRNVISGASVTSHEFFHAWNVKRIHPKVLGPFEYEHENYTGNLWVSEGWTSYYGDLALARADLMTRDAYLGQLAATIRGEWSKESHRSQSVYWASRNVWHHWPDEPQRVDYYGTGEVLGCLIDLKIRHETENKKSLDDVMRFMNRWFGERRLGFEEDDVERACTAVSNYDFSEFFIRHVRGTVTPPFGEYLAYAGIEYKEDRVNVDFPFAMTDADDGTHTVRIRRQGAPKEDGLMRGDVVLTINGRKVPKIADFLKTAKAGDEVSLEYRRGEEPAKTIKVKLVERNAFTNTIAFKPNPTPLEAAIRESWLTGR